jgi:MFS family permease
MTASETSGARALLGASLVARLPLAMFSIALLVHVRQLTGSFAAAGAATGAYAAAVGAGGPLLGRMADRRGHTAPLLGAAAVSFKKKTSHHKLI